MNGKLLLPPSTDRALFYPSDDEISPDSEPPTKKAAESVSLKCDCITSSFCIGILFYDRFEPFFAIATLIGGPFVARNEKESCASHESVKWSIFAYCYSSIRCCH